MVINQNWDRYEVDIGWKEVPASEVLNNSLIMKLLDETITKSYLENILELDDYLEDTLTKSYLENILELDDYLANTLTKAYLNSIMEPSYTNGVLQFNE